MLKTISNSTRITMALVSLLVSVQAAAADSPEKKGMSPPLQTILVTASRLDVDGYIEQSVLSRADIELLGPNSTGGLLRTMPHLFVFENGGVGGTSFASVRGGDPNFLLVLVDGIIVNDPTSSRGGGFDFSQLDPSAIDSVEVFRGGVSALYGGEGLSGALHIKTREGSGSELAATVGNEGQRQLSGVLRAKTGDGLSVLAMVSHNALKRSPEQNYRNEQLLVKVSKSGERGTGSLLASVSDQRAASFPEDSGGELSTLGLPEHRDSRQSLFGARSSLRLSDLLSANVQLSRTEHEETTVSPGIALGELGGIPPTSISSKFRQTTVDANLAAQNWGAFNFLLGGSSRWSEGENSGFVDFGFPVPVDYELDQHTLSAYAEMVASYARWKVSVGARLDNPDGFDSELSSRLRLSVALSDTVTVESSYSEGFKLPSFFALSNPLVGNPELQPEYSVLRSVSIGMVAGPRVDLSATYFDNDYRNLVDFEPESFTNINRSRVDASGVELDLAWRANESAHVAASVTYLDAESAADETPLRRRPRWLAQVQANLSWGWRGQGFFALRHRSAFSDSSQLTGSLTLNGYSSLDAGWRWNPVDSVTLSVNVDNLLDEVMEDAVGFTDTGRLMRLGVRYRL